MERIQYYEYKTRNNIDGKVFKGIITADNIEIAEMTLKKRGEDIIELSEMRDIFNIRKKQKTYASLHFTYKILSE